MINIAALTLIFQSIIIFTTLIVVVAWLWPNVRLDSFRQNMFAIRDELFDYAASSRIGFNDPAYRLLRQSMNGFIRYGHRISFFQITMTKLTRKMVGHNIVYGWTEKWQAALKSVTNDEVRKELERFHERSSLLVFERIVLGSPVLLGLLLVCLIILLFHVGLHSARSALNRAIAKVSSLIIDPRLLDEEAARAAS